TQSAGAQPAPADGPMSVTAGTDRSSDPAGTQSVVVIRWPQDAQEAQRLAELEQPRLLLVAPDAPAPEGGACEEDWVRLPASDPDVAARLRALRRRVDRHQLAPRLDGSGRLIHRRKWVSLSPIEERILGVLVDRFGTVVPDADLIDVGWSEDPPTLNALRVHLNRIRRRIAPLGLTVSGVRSHGQVLEEKSKLQ
ncbi:MAG: helix-turn-helix domain-containing protein, partial [Actinomycetota bacterium]|nr:helix-turn-helix domain-containing protein [Actinomycetota bacterium]